MPHVYGMVLEFVWVPAGDGWDGVSADRDHPCYDPEALPSATPRQVRVRRGFWMGTHPVTNAQFSRYAAARAVSHDVAGSQRFGRADQPVTHVQLQDGLGYAAWCTELLGDTVRLPTHDEWAWAARGPTARRFPWGSARPHRRLAACGQRWADGAPVAVGGRPEGAGPFGTQDMAGNVWEWCLQEGPTAVRGGGWDALDSDLRCAVRRPLAAHTRSPTVGFRLVLDGTLH